MFFSGGNSCKQKLQVYCIKPEGSIKNPLDYIKGHLYMLNRSVHVFFQATYHVNLKSDVPTRGSDMMIHAICSVITMRSTSLRRSIIVSILVGIW